MADQPKSNRYYPTISPDMPHHEVVNAIHTAFDHIYDLRDSAPTPEKAAPTPAQPSKVTNIHGLPIKAMDPGDLKDGSSLKWVAATGQFEIVNP